MKDKFGIGIIGCGEISAAHYSAYQRLAKECEIVAVSDVVEPAAQRRADEFGVKTVYTNYHDLLANDLIDIVAVCTPHYLHARMSIDAANAGKHVLVEKPMCMNVGEVNEMVYAAKKNKVKFTMATERVNPYHRFIKEQVLSEIGDISFSYLIDFYFRNLAYFEKGRWRGTWAREGGAVFANQAIYTWDTYQWFFGGVDSVYGYWANLLHPNIEVEDIGYGLIHFRDGTHGKFLTSGLCDAPDDTTWLRIIGSEGEVFSKLPWLYTINFSLNDKDKEKKLRTEMESYVAGLTGPGYDDDWDDSHARRVLLQMRDIMQAIREDRDVTISPESCGEAIKILNGIHWNGWNHSDAFRKWAYLNFDMPKAVGPHALPTVDDARVNDWRGGELVKTLMDIVTDPEPHLEAPFL